MKQPNRQKLAWAVGRFEAVLGFDTQIPHQQAKLAYRAGRMTSRFTDLHKYDQDQHEQTKRLQLKLREAIEPVLTLGAEPRHQTVKGLGCVSLEQGKISLYRHNLWGVGDIHAVHVNTNDLNYGWPGLRIAVQGGQTVNREAYNVMPTAYTSWAVDLMSEWTPLLIQK